MTLTRQQKIAYRLLGPAVHRVVETNPRFSLVLQRAHIRLRPETYLASTYLNMGVAFAGLLFVVLVAAILKAVGLLPIPAFAFAFLVPVPLIVAVSLYLLAYLIPELQAAQRARDIDAKLPYALNYISIMANAGVPPQQIFASLASQPLYGEVANEAAWISRDVHMLGRDLMTALQRAIERSPSVRFQDFLQGTTTALASGEDLKTYFLSKSKQFFVENRQSQKRFLESLGILTESFVTVVVAAPLLLIVLLTVMQMFGGSSNSAFRFGYVIVLLLLPVSMYGFGSAIKFITPKV